MSEPSMQGRTNAGESSVELRKVRIPNRLGLHARPAAELVKLAATFEAEVQLTKDGLQVNGKSIMGVLMLAAEQGTELVVEARGVDAREAADAIEALIQRGFGER
jgi:phosphocarrier protein HPr